MNSISASQKQDILEWRPEVSVCPHTLDLNQENNNVKVKTGNPCSQCDLKENLWLCLICGALNCGRNQLGGAPGNSHGIAHYDSTHHPVAVKLGSITPDGTADIYCYACDDEVKDHHLAEHLAHFGINIADAEKTEKSLTEMQLEQNVKWDFSMVSETGQDLEPLFGPGFTGLKNLGNSCYISSVLQCLFSLPQFIKGYYRPDEMQKIIDNPESNLEVQLVKLADGLLSGRYAVPDPDLNNEGKPTQRGIPPAAFKKLIGEGHAEFSSMKQQDSFEFLTYFLGKLQAYCKSNKLNDPSKIFKFKTEQRLECLGCHKVRYNTTVQEALTLQVPVRRISNAETEDEDDTFETVNITELFDNFTKTEEVDYKCKSCSNPNSIKKVSFETFPDSLILNAQRFEIINWVPTKLNIPLEVSGDELTLSEYKAKEHSPDEDIAMDDDDDEEDKSEKFVANPEALEFLVQMGYTRNCAERALFNTENQLEASVEWIMSHMDDPDLNDPFSVGGKKAKPAVSKDQVEQLTMMGFSENAARKALYEAKGNNEAAVEWLFSNSDDPGYSEAELDELVNGSEGSNDDDDVYCGSGELPANYKLKAIVCHKGRSVHAGHYVAFIKKEVKGVEQWVLYNDEKVVSGGEIEEMKKYAYIYIFTRV